MNSVYPFDLLCVCFGFALCLLCVCFVFALFLLWFTLYLFCGNFLLCRICRSYRSFTSNQSVKKNFFPFQVFESKSKYFQRLFFGTEIVSKLRRQKSGTISVPKKRRWKTYIMNRINQTVWFWSNNKISNINKL